MLPQLGIFRELGPEVKAAAFFGVGSLFLSLVIGLAAGNTFGNAFLTSFVMALVFSILGYAAVTVVKRFVPELFEVFAGASAPGSGDFQGEAPVAPERADSRPAGGDSGYDGEPAESEEKEAELKTGIDFEPVDSASYARYSSKPEMGDGKLGKHIVVNQKKVKYEPKIVAEAIRTMMKRDNE